MQDEVNPDVQPYRTSEYPIDAAFLNRWSPRAFADKPVDDTTLMQIFEGARWAASAYNEQPWRFLFARTDEDRTKFLEFLVPFNAAWAKAAPVIILVVAKKTFSHNGTPNSTHAYDAGTASGYLALQTALLGLVAHGMSGFDADKAREICNIPEDFVPLAVYALGYQGDKATLPEGLQEREVPSERRPLAESLMEGGFKTGEEAKAEADTENDGTPVS